MIARLLLPWATTAYACPICCEVGCCEHKPVCDYDGDCPLCHGKPRVADATTAPEAQMLALELALRHAGGMTTEAGDGYRATPPPDGTRLSVLLGAPSMLPEGRCPRCDGPIEVPWVVGYLARECRACGELTCVHVAFATGPGSRSFPYRVRTYARNPEFGIDNPDEPE
jgi:hypothetical protein